MAETSYTSTTVRPRTPRHPVRLTLPLLLLALAGTPGAAWAQARGVWAGMALLPAPAGFAITNVADRGPAQLAGLRPGDVVLSFDDRRFATPRDLRRHLLDRGVGTRHRVTYQRGVAQYTAMVQLAHRPTPEDFVRLFLNDAPLPDFTLPRVPGGAAMRLGGLRGRVVLLFFCASWCDACKSVLPLLARLHRGYERRGVTVLALGRDASALPLAAVTRRYALPFPVLHDQTNRVGRLNRVRVLPSLVFLDRQGVVRRYLAGASDIAQQVERVVRQLLSGGPAGPARTRADLEVWS